MQRDMTAPRYLRRGLPLRKVEANARRCDSAAAAVFAAGGVVGEVIVRLLSG